MTSTRPQLRNRFRLVSAILCLVAIPFIAAWLGSLWSYGVATPVTEIYRGVRYSCSESEGQSVHVAEIDLAQPGIELFLTPLDEVALERGFQYRLDYVRNVARKAGLAVAVNGALFESDSYLFPMVGDFARGVDTVVAEHQPSHLHPHSYLLWFDDNLTPHLETNKPPSKEALANAKWGIGGQGVVLHAGKTSSGDNKRDRRAILGVDPPTRRLWVAVFESATSSEAAAFIAQCGATEAIMLDGGDSAAIYLGGHTYGLPSGLRFGGHRPVATVFGVKADPIIDPL